MIVAALIALVQIDAARKGQPSFLATAVGTLASGLQTGVAAGLEVVRSAAGNIGDLPNLRRQNAALEASVEKLRSENASLREALAQAPDVAAQARAEDRYPGAIPALTIGFDPENQARVATVNAGSRSGVRVEDGVVTDDGVVGRVIANGPFSSSVMLLTDSSSKIPAVVQRGRWWGIATGTGTSVQLQFVSQDAPLRAGDLIVTGEGRSFHAGIPIGRIVSISHPEGALYQSALVAPAAALGRLAHVLVLPH